MSKELHARAEKQRERNKTLESVPGSGYHDNDKDHAGRPSAPQKNNLPKISDHLMVFHGEDENHFVGACAEKAMKAIQDWYAKNKPRNPYEMTGTEQKLVGRYIPKLKMGDADGHKTLMIRLGEWNDFFWLFHQEGLGLTGQPLEEVKS